MFQSFAAHARPEQGPPRLAALRAEMARAGLDAFIVPRADAHQGEYVAPCDERLAWLTGFTGSAGFCLVTATDAGIFIDGRYRTQVRAEVTLSHFTPVNWPEVQPGAWLKERLKAGQIIGYDPWLATKKQLDELHAELEEHGVSLSSTTNSVDAIWIDRPAPPLAQAVPYPPELAGESGADKRTRIAAALREAGQSAAVLTLPDSIAWLLNIRGGDLPRIPVVQAFAILTDDGTVALFTAPEKFPAETRAHLGEAVTIHPTAEFAAALAALKGPVRLDPASAPIAVAQALEAAGIEIQWQDDPCRLPKARKNPAELAAAAEAHLRDGAAMVEFLAWFDAQSPGGLKETQVVTALEGFRRATNALRDISFDTICGSGPNGAVIHYRVTEASDRRIGQGEIVVIDSGGQYLDGTTDITRTVAVGPPPPEAVAAFTRVLQGMIAISRLEWPEGLAGRDLDPFARAALWRAGQDYDHGTGHGVGAYLSVHEGPQRLSRLGTVPLEAGMILSNEPGYYREGAFGFRIENLVVVEPAPARPEGDPQRRFLKFRTLTEAPIDRRLIDAGILSAEERGWLNAYHAGVAEKLAPKVSAEAREWLLAATAAI